MPGRFRSRAVEGEYVRYDGANAAEIEAFAGGQYDGADGQGRPVVRSAAGDPYPLRPGWVLSRAGEAGHVSISDPPAWAERAEEAA